MARLLLGMVRPTVVDGVLPLLLLLLKTLQHHGDNSPRFRLLLLPDGVLQSNLQLPLNLFLLAMPAGVAHLLLRQLH